MTDPKRLLESESDDPAASLERELLASLRPPDTAQGEVWQRLAKSGVIALGVSGTVGATSKVAAASGLGSKLALVLVVAAPLVGGALYLSRKPESAPPRPAPVATVPGVAIAQAAPSAAAAPPASGAAEPMLEKSAERASSPAAALREENRLLREAREALRSSDAERSLALLRQLDARFPRGSLTQERELVHIQALRSAGRNSEASVRAQRFLKVYPESPYAEHVRKALSDDAR